MRALAFALIASLATVTAHAEGTGTWYAGPFLMGGITDADDFGRTPAGPGAVSGGTDSGGISGGIGGWLGYDFSGYGEPVALELSSSWRFRHDMNIDFTDTTSGLPSRSKSNIQTTDFILSLLYELPIGTTSWQPYLGGGAGVAWSDMETDYLVGATNSPAGNASDVNFAWQLQGGLKVPLEHGLNLRFDYRYVDLGTVKTGAMPVATADRFEADLASHDLRVGMTWDF